MARRVFPLMASGLLLAITMFTSTVGPAFAGRSQWALPQDYWGTLLAAVRLAHLDVGGIYVQPTGLVSLPGTAVILLPVAAVIVLAGMSLDIPGAYNPHPGVWLVAGPYEVAISCVALFAADALAERLGISRRRRALLAVAGGVALWNVAGRWGHPEDAVATGLLMYAALMLDRRRLSAAAWLTGAAACVQPLALLAVPVLSALLPWHRVPGFLTRAALPSVVLVAVALAANLPATWSAVTSQPDSAVINHPTPWTPLAAHLAGGNVAAGPFRLAAVAVACACGLALRRRWRAHPPLAEVLWWMAFALALRSLFEPVMVPYYPWPALALALIPAAAMSWRRLIRASAVTAAVTGLAQGPWQSVWLWWLPVMAGLTLLLGLGAPAVSREGRLRMTCRVADG